MTSPKRSPSVFKIAFVAIVFTLGFVAYDFFFNQNVSADATAPQGVTDAQSAVMDKIDAIKLDASIFKDPVYTSLEDNSVSIGSEAPGKANPFAPFPGSSAVNPPVQTGTKTK